MQRALRQWILLPLLLVYFACLALAAIRAEVRPALLDAPHAAALQVLHAVGVEPGIAVFSDVLGLDEKIRAICVRVRGLDPDGRPVELYPATGTCVRSGFRFRLPPVELAVSHILEQARSHQHAVVDGRSPAQNRARSERVLGHAGRYFCQASERAGRTLSEVSLVWYVHKVSYASGAEWPVGYLNFRWSCRLALPLVEEWMPPDDAVVAFWGGEPWR